MSDILDEIREEIEKKESPNIAMVFIFPKDHVCLSCGDKMRLKADELLGSMVMTQVQCKECHTPVILTPPQKQGTVQ